MLVAPRLRMTSCDASAPHACGDGSCSDSPRIDIVVPRKAMPAEIELLLASSLPRGSLLPTGLGASPARCSNPGSSWGGRGRRGAPAREGEGGRNRTS
jgi:hypothetical protein